MVGGEYPPGQEPPCGCKVSSAFLAARLRRPCLPGHAPQLWAGTAAETAGPHAGWGALPGSQHTSPPLPKIWRQIRELWLEQHLAAGGGAAKRSWPGCSRSWASWGVGHVALATSGCGIASTLHLPRIIPPGPRAKEPQGGGPRPWEWAGGQRQNVAMWQVWPCQRSTWVSGWDLHASQAVPIFSSPQPSIVDPTMIPVLESF